MKIEECIKILVEVNPIKLWQHEETGKITTSKFQPSGRWYEIPTMYEDELPEDMSDKLYSWWFDNSFVDGVRMGPKIKYKSNQNEGCMDRFEQILEELEERRIKMEVTK